MGSLSYRWKNGYLSNLKIERFLDYIDAFVSEDDEGITAFVSMRGGKTYVVAFDDDTVVYVNGTFQGVINSGERLNLSLNAGDVISANKPIMVNSSDERHSVITWKSTKFVIPFYRADNQVIYIYAPDADANVDVYVGNSTTPTTSTTVTKGTATHVLFAASPPSTVIVESDTPIIITVASNNGTVDFRFVYPPSKELIEIPSSNSYISALEDNTTIVWYQGNNSGTYTMNRGDIVAVSALGMTTGSQYNATPFRLISNKPVMVSSFADGDGTDATCGLPIRALPTKMVLPVAAQWLSIAVPYPDTTVRIYYQGVLKYETIVSNSYSSLLAPVLLYLSPSDIDSSWTSIPYGTVIETDKPVYVVFDCAEVWTDDETVLIGINSRKWRTYKNPVLSLTTDLVPPQDGTYDLGSSSYRWKDGYFAGAINAGSLSISGIGNLGSLQIGGTEVIDSSRVLKNISSIGQSLLPLSDNAYDIGSSSLRWRNMFGVNIYVSNTLYIKRRSDNSYIPLELGTISTLADGQSLNLQIVLDTTNVVDKAEYLTEFTFDSTSYISDYNFGTITFEQGSNNDLKEVFLIFQADIQPKQDGVYNGIWTTYIRLLKDGTEYIVLSQGTDAYGNCPNGYVTHSAEVASPPESATYTTEVKRDSTEGSANNACTSLSSGVRNRYIRQKVKYYKIQIYN